MRTNYKAFQSLICQRRAGTFRREMIFRMIGLVKAALRRLVEFVALIVFPVVFVIGLFSLLALVALFLCGEL
jgi:hypothetical protein